MDASLLLTLTVTCVAFTGIWLINVMTEDAGVIDYYWGPGFSVIAGIHAWWHGVASVYQWILLAAIIVWSVRLAGQLVPRHHSASGEDGRYRAMREGAGASFWWSSLFKVFLLQAVLLWMIAAPVHIAFGPSATGTVMVGAFWIGMAIFAIGLAIEAIADRQLEDGKRLQGGEPESSLVTSGLWAVSRHPNYVGEMILWWGLALSAFAISGSAWVFVGPALLCAVMAGVSMPLTEQHMLRTRPGYPAYMQRVPALIGLQRSAARTGETGGGNQPAE